MAALLVSLALGCEHCERGLGRPLPKSCTGRDVHDIAYEAKEAAGEIKAAASGAVTSVMQARGARRGMRRLEEERDEPQASGGRGDAHDSDDETLVLAAATTSVEPDPFDDLPPWALAVVEEAVATAHAVRASEDHGLD